jgi:hypothetical protein
LCWRYETVHAKNPFMIEFMFKEENLSCQETVLVFFYVQGRKSFTPRFRSCFLFIFKAQTVHVKNSFMFLLLFKVGNYSCLGSVYVLIYVQWRKPFMPWIPHVWIYIQCRKWSMIYFMFKVENCSCKESVHALIYVQGRKHIIFYISYFTFSVVPYTPVSKIWYVFDYLIHIYV